MEQERNIFWEVFNGLEHQGPGGAEYTRQAIKLLPNLSSRPKVLDIGCGTGSQTLVLAETLEDAEITAIDTNDQALLDLQARAKTSPLRSTIRPLNRSMFELGLEKESFDLIWSEGAIYIIGFKNGLKEWVPLLKSRSCFVASHLSWISDEIPQEVRTFWGKETEVLPIAENCAAMETAGLEVISAFILPREGWWENFYVPILNRLDRIRQTSLTAEQTSAANIIESEIDLYRKHGSCYSYVFYIGRKR